MGRAVAGGISAIALVIAGCAAGASRPVLPTGALVVPTDENLLPSAQSGVLCTLGAVLPPVKGVLAGDTADAAWPVWLDDAAGRRLYVLWPRGFSVRFDPVASLLDETGTPFAIAGSEVTLEQVGPDPAKGTTERPYVAEGLSATGLGHVQHCYTYRP
jgi:hypothetical protein